MELSRPPYNGYSNCNILGQNNMRSVYHVKWNLVYELNYSVMWHEPQPWNYVVAAKMTYWNANKVDHTAQCQFLWPILTWYQIPVPNCTSLVSDNNIQVTTNANHSENLTEMPLSLLPWRKFSNDFKDSMFMLSQHSSLSQSIFHSLITKQ